MVRRPAALLVVMSSTSFTGAPGSSPSRGARHTRGPLASRDFLLLLAATFGVAANFTPMLSVAPLWAAEGGAGHAGAGAATAATMAATVAIQFLLPRILRRYGAQRALAVGALLLGLPTFAYVLSASLAWVLLISAVRGIGFGLAVVAASTLAAGLVPAAQRGRAVGLYGVAIGLPQILLLPLGVWVAEHVGFAVVFAGAGAGALLGAGFAARIAGRDPAGGDLSGVPGGAPTGAQTLHPAGASPSPRSLAGPSLLLLAASCAMGGITTLLPLTLAAPGAAAVALFLVSAAIVAGRWAAGVHTDRHMAGTLLLPGILACGTGMVGFAIALANPGGEAAWAAGAALAFGLGFGALQNDTLVVLFARTKPAAHGTASTVWNMAFDAGTGIGALAIGIGAQWFGASYAFAVTSVLIVVAAPLASRERRRAA